jgi:hypothetical protein
LPPQQYVSGAGVLLEAGSKVHRVADGDALAETERSDYDLASVDPVPPWHSIIAFIRS